MFLRSENFVYFSPVIGGNLFTHPVAINNLSYPNAYFDYMLTFLFW